MAARETFAGFRRLPADEALNRAKAAEERPRSSESNPVDTRTWRRLYREMRRTKVSSVGDLEPTVLEEYAAKLGYGYFRRDMGARNAFLAFEGRA